MTGLHTELARIRAALEHHLCAYLDERGQVHADLRLLLEALDRQQALAAVLARIAQTRSGALMLAYYGDWSCAVTAPDTVGHGAGDTVEEALRHAAEDAGWLL